MTAYILIALTTGLWVCFAKGTKMKVGGGVIIALLTLLFINKVIRKDGNSGYSLWKNEGNHGGPFWYLKEKYLGIVLPENEERY